MVLGVSCGGGGAVTTNDPPIPRPQEYEASQCHVAIDAAGTEHSFVAYGEDLRTARYRGARLADAVSEIVRVGRSLAPRFDVLVSDTPDASRDAASGSLDIPFSVARCERVELATADEGVTARWTASLPSLDVTTQGEATAVHPTEALEVARRRACLGAHARYALQLFGAVAGAPPEQKASFIDTGMADAEALLFACMRDGAVTFGERTPAAADEPLYAELVRCEATVTGVLRVPDGRSIGAGFGRSSSAALEDARLSALVDAYRGIDVSFADAVQNVDPSMRSVIFAVALERALLTGVFAPLVDRRWGRCERWDEAVSASPESSFTLPENRECAFADGVPRTRAFSMDAPFASCDAVRAAGRAWAREMAGAAEEGARTTMRAAARGQAISCERGCRRTLSLRGATSRPIPRTEPEAPDCSTEARARATLAHGKRDRDVTLALACLDAALVSEVLRDLDALTVESVFVQLAQLDGVVLEAHAESDCFRLRVPAE